MIVTTKFKDQSRTGKIHDIIKHYEGRGYGAQKDGDHVLMNELFQHAEHYRRTQNGRT